MNIAIVGSSGYIASALIRRMEQEASVGSILKIDRTADADAYLDLADARQFDYELLDTVDLVIFTAAVSGPDRCALEFEACWNINVEGTGRFIREALERGARVLFFSSDAVFGDIPGHIYTEESETKGDTAYGRMKKAVEDRFLGHPLFKAIRLSYVASSGDHFVTYCLDCIRNGEAAEVFHPFYRNCTVLTDVVDIVLWFARHFDAYKPSVLNAAGPELVSRIRIADEINRVLGGRLSYTVTMTGDEFFKNRPRITQMKSLYLEPYNITEKGAFTEKIQKELRGVKL